MFVDRASGLVLMNSGERSFPFGNLRLHRQLLNRVFQRKELYKNLVISRKSAPHERQRPSESESPILLPSNVHAPSSPTVEERIPPLSLRLPPPPNALNQLCIRSSLSSPPPFFIIVGSFSDQTPRGTSELTPPEGIASKTGKRKGSRRRVMDGQ